MTDPETHFPIDDQEDDLSASTCTVWRGAKTANNFMEIKLGVQHKVTTGYKVYTTGTGVTNGEVQYSGNGMLQEMMFESATSVLAGAVLLVSLLTF